MKNPFESLVVAGGAVGAGATPSQHADNDAGTPFPPAVKGHDKCVYRRRDAPGGGETEGSAATAHPHAVYLPEVVANASNGGPSAEVVEAHGWKATFDHSKGKLYFSKLSDKKQRCWTLPAYTAADFNISQTATGGEVGKKTKKKGSKRVAGAPKKKAKKKVPGKAPQATEVAGGVAHSQDGDGSSTESGSDDDEDDDDGRDGQGGGLHEHRYDQHPWTNPTSTTTNPLGAQHPLAELSGSGYQGADSTNDVGDPFSLPNPLRGNNRLDAPPFGLMADGPAGGIGGVGASSNAVGVVGTGWGMGMDAFVDPYAVAADGYEDDNSELPTRSTAPVPNVDAGRVAPAPRAALSSEDDEAGVYYDDDRAGASELHRQERSAVYVASSVEIPDDAVPPLSSPMPLSKGKSGEGGRGGAAASSNAGNSCGVVEGRGNERYAESMDTFDARQRMRREQLNESTSDDDMAGMPIARMLSSKKQQCIDREAGGRDEIVAAEFADRDVIAYEAAADFEDVSFNQKPQTAPPTTTTVSTAAISDPRQQQQRNQLQRDVAVHLQGLIVAESANNVRKEEAVERELAILIQKRALQERVSKEHTSHEDGAVVGAPSSNAAATASQLSGTVDEPTDAQEARDRTPLEELLERTATDGGAASQWSDSSATVVVHSPLLRDEDFPLSSLATHVRVDSMQLAAQPEVRHDYVVDARVHPEHHAASGATIPHPFEPMHHRPKGEAVRRDGKAHPVFVDEPTASFAPTASAPAADVGPHDVVVEDDAHRTGATAMQQPAPTTARRQRAVAFDDAPGTSTSIMMTRTNGSEALSSAPAEGRRRHGPPTVAVVDAVYTAPAPGAAGILVTAHEQRPVDLQGCAMVPGDGRHGARPHVVTLVEAALPARGGHGEGATNPLSIGQSAPSNTTTTVVTIATSGSPDSTASEYSPSFGPRIDSFSEDGSPASASLPPSFATGGRRGGGRLRNARDSFIIALHPDEHRAYVEGRIGHGAAAQPQGNGAAGELIEGDDVDPIGEASVEASEGFDGGRGGSQRFRNARDSFFIAQHPDAHHTYVQKHRPPGDVDHDAPNQEPEDRATAADGSGSMSLGSDSASSPRVGGRLRRARDSFFIASHPSEHRAYVQNRIGSSPPPPSLATATPAAAGVQGHPATSSMAAIESTATTSADNAFPNLKDSVVLTRHPQGHRAYVQEQLQTISQLSGMEWDAIEQQRRLALAQDRHAAAVDDASRQLHALDATQALARLRQLQASTTALGVHDHATTQQQQEEQHRSCAATEHLLQREDALRWIQEEARRRTGRTAQDYRPSSSTSPPYHGANGSYAAAVHWLQPPQADGDGSLLSPSSHAPSSPQRRMAMGEDPSLLLEQRIDAVMQRLLTQDAMYLYQQALDAKLLESADWSLDAMHIYQHFVDTMPPKVKEASVQTPDTAKAVVDCGTSAPPPVAAFTPSFPLGQPPSAAEATYTTSPPPPRPTAAQRSGTPQAEAMGEEDIALYLQRIERIRSLRDDDDAGFIAGAQVQGPRQRSPSATQPVGMWASRHRAVQTPALPRELLRPDAGAALQRLRHGRAALEQYHGTASTSPRPVTLDHYNGATPLGYERAPHRQTPPDATPMRPAWYGAGAQSTPSSVVSTPPPLPGSVLTKPQATIGQQQQPFLRWDVKRSGNVLVSQSGALTMADSSRALKALQEEAVARGGDHHPLSPAGGRPHAASPRVAIPMYALGTIGISQGDFVFECRFELRPSKEVVPSTSSFFAGAPSAGPRRAAASVVSTSVLRPGQRRPQHAVYIGVASKYYRGSQRTTAAYLYGSDGTITATSTEGKGIPYGQVLHSNAVVTVHLSFARRELSFAVDGVPQGVAFKFQRQDDPEPLFPLVVFTGDGDSCAFQAPSLPSPPGGGTAHRSPLLRAAAANNASSGRRDRSSPRRRADPEQQASQRGAAVGGRSGGTGRYDGGAAASPLTPRDVSRPLY